MKTKYLIPQTEAIAVQGEKLMQFPGSPGDGEMPHAPQRGFTPGGGDLGGVPTN